MANKTHSGGKVVGPGVCITKDCRNDRISPSWYCQPCQDDFIATRNGNRDRDPDKARHQNRASDDDTRLTGTAWGHGTRPRTQAPVTATQQTETGYSGVGNRDWTKKYAGLVTDTVGASLSTGKRNVPCDGPGTGHDGRTPFLTLADSRVLYGAKGIRLNDPGARDHLDLIIDCAGMVTRSADGFVQSVPAKYAGIVDVKGPDIIRLQWPDLQAPRHVGIAFWERLYAALPGHTCVCCVGSHGRTGTALACLLVASGMDPELAIITVRQKHCARAIETPEQERYIRQLRKGQKPAKVQTGTHPAQVPPGDPDDDPTLPRQTRDADVAGIRIQVDGERGGK